MSKRVVVTAEFSVQLRIPAGSTVVAMQSFLIDAMEEFKKSFPRDDPKAAFDPHSLRVKLVKRSTEYL